MWKYESVEDVKCFVMICTSINQFRYALGIFAVFPKANAKSALIHRYAILRH